MEDLLAIIAARKPAKRALPTQVKKKLSEKRRNARAAGVCLRCGHELIADKDGVLRSTLITAGIGGPGHPLCTDRRPHELDPARTFYPGKTRRKTGTGDGEPNY